MRGPSFQATSTEVEMALEVVLRFERIAPDHPAVRDRLSLHMDMIACHANGCPLRLEDMLAGSDLDLVHDVAGVWGHIDRNTGKLVGCFLPRFARRQEAA